MAQQPPNHRAGPSCVLTSISRWSGPSGSLTSRFSWGTLVGPAVVSARNQPELPDSLTAASGAVVAKHSHQLLPRSHKLGHHSGWCPVMVIPCHDPVFWHTNDRRTRPHFNTLYSVIWFLGHLVAAFQLQTIHDNNHIQGRRDDLIELRCVSLPCSHATKHAPPQAS